MKVSKFPQISSIFLGIGIGLFGGAMLWAKASPQAPKYPDVIRAQRFEVVDADGKVIAILGQDSDKGTILKLASKNTQGGTIIFSDPDGGQHLMMGDVNRQTALELRTDEDAWVRMLNSKQKKERTIKP